MAVLITGGAGFVGLNLAEALLERDEPVVLFDLREPPPEFVASAGSQGARMRCVVGDVRQSQDVNRAFSAGDITHVFHGAVITSGPAREVSDPNSIVEVNLSGTLNVLKAARVGGVRRFVFPSSISVYGQSLFDRESVSEAYTPAVPESIYGVTKYAAERAALRLGDLWGLEVIAGRIGNVFGPWEGETGVRDLITPLAQIATAAIQGKQVILPDVSIKRDLIYSRDLARSLVSLLYVQQPGFSTYNLSVEADWSDIYIRWCRTVAAKFDGFDWRVAQPGEVANIDYHDRRDRARMDTARAQADFGFVPAYSPDVALEDYVQWLKATTHYFVR
jgi:nucleoside-diphosphate-sugar epimerase